MSSRIVRMTVALVAATALAVPILPIVPLAVALAPLPTMRAVAVGANHTCALTTGGAVKCWGSNALGQLGDGSTYDRQTPADVVGLTGGVVAIGAGEASTCAVTRAGGVRCWGNNESGRLGNGTSANSSVPVDVVGLTSGVTAIAVGMRHACALTTSGGVKCWGSLIRDGTFYARTTPIDVFGATSDIRAITAGYNYSCALTNGGGVRCWGANDMGVLGNGTTTSSSVPVNVASLTSGVIAIAAGRQHTCALTSGGAMTCWGDNYAGQLGDGTPAWQLLPDGTYPRSLVPVGVLGLTGAMGIAVGGGHTCALTAAGGAACWGDNGYGQLGDGTRLASGSPILVEGLSRGVAAVAAGVSSDHTCALMTTGGVKCWGHNEYGTLGDGRTSDSSVPVDVDFTIRPTIALRSSKPSGTIAAGRTLTLTAAVKPVEAAAAQVVVRFEIYRLDAGSWNLAAQRDVAAAATGMATLRWTFATEGMRSVRARALVNVPDRASNWSPSLTYKVVKTIAVPAFTAIAAGDLHNCAIRRDGGVMCWGLNDSGQLGDGSTTNSSIPINVSGLPDRVTAISAGGHTCAVTIKGSVLCWGFNDDGRLGDGTFHSSSVPVAVSGLAGGVAAVDVGSTSSCVLTTAGGVRCWGINGRGQLGDGTTITRLAPVDVLGLATGVRAIAVGGEHACALTVAGGVTCWGSNYAGQLGNGTAVDSSTPVDVSGLGSGVIAITAGIAHTCALGRAGGVMCWGGLAASQGAEGGLYTTFALVPAQVPGLTSGVASIAAGAFQTCAVSDAGGATCWGDNRHGQLGNGTTRLSRTPVAVKGLANGVAAMTASYGHTCALMTSGGARCWGWNDAGVLGNGSTIAGTTPADVFGTFVRRPDVRIRGGAGSVGNNVYNATGAGQTIAGSLTLGDVITFGISIENDGNGYEDFEVQATGAAARGFAVRYYRGTADITAAVVAGTYRTPSLKPGGTWLITAMVSVGQNAAVGSSVTRLVTLTSGADVPVKDAVKLVVRRA